jgi:hypothetical protein
MVSPQRTLRYPYNKVQGPLIIVGWTMMVSTTSAWGMEPTTSSLGAMSAYHQAKARGAFGSPPVALVHITNIPSHTKPSQHVAPTCMINDMWSMWWGWEAGGFIFPSFNLAHQIRFFCNWIFNLCPIKKKLAHQNKQHVIPNHEPPMWLNVLI